MGPGETITSIVAIIGVFGGIFGGAAYIVHRVLRHRQRMRELEVEAHRQPASAPNDELLRAVAQELHTQRQMLTYLHRQLEKQGVISNAEADPEAEAFRAPAPDVRV